MKTNRSNWSTGALALAGLMLSSFLIYMLSASREELLSQPGVDLAPGEPAHLEGPDQIQESGGPGSEPTERLKSSSGSALDPEPLVSGILEVLAIVGDERLGGVDEYPLSQTKIEVFLAGWNTRGEKLGTAFTNLEGLCEISLSSWPMDQRLVLFAEGHCRTFWFCDGGTGGATLAAGGRVSVVKRFLPTADLRVEIVGLPVGLEVQHVRCLANVYSFAGEERKYIATEFDEVLVVKDRALGFHMPVPAEVKISLFLEGEKGLTFKHNTGTTPLMMLASGESRVLRIDLGSTCSIEGELLGVPDNFLEACAIVVEYMAPTSHNAVALPSEHLLRRQRHSLFGGGASRSFQFAGLPDGSHRLVLEASSQLPHIPLRDMATGARIWDACEQAAVRVEPSEPLIGFVWVDESGEAVQEHDFTLARDEDPLRPPSRQAGGIHIVPSSWLRGASSVLLYSSQFGFHSIDVDGLDLDFTQVVQIPIQSRVIAVGRLRVDIGSRPPEDLRVRVLRDTPPGHRVVFWGWNWEGGLKARRESDGWIFDAVPPGKYVLELAWNNGGESIPATDAPQVEIEVGRESWLRMSLPERPTSIHVRVSNWGQVQGSYVGYDVHAVDDSGAISGPRSKVKGSREGNQGGFDLAFVGSPPQRVGLLAPWMSSGVLLVPLEKEPGSGGFSIDLPLEPSQQVELLLTSIASGKLWARGGQGGPAGTEANSRQSLASVKIPGGVRISYCGRPAPRGTIWEGQLLRGWFDLSRPSGAQASSFEGREMTIAFSESSGLVEVFAVGPDSTASDLDPASLGIVDMLRRTLLWVPDSTRVLRFELKGTSLQMEMPVNPQLTDLQVSPFLDDSR